MPAFTPEIAAACRREETDALALMLATKFGEDLRGQLDHAVEWIRELTGLPREEINRRIAQRRADAAGKP